MTGRPVRTVGVAIAVPEPYGSRLQAHRASFGDPRGRTVPTHITLLPPTELPAGSSSSNGTAVAGPADSLSRDVETHLAAVAASVAPFEVVLRGTASFRPVSPVVYVPLVEGGKECGRLEQLVRSGPLAREVAFAFHPHVTVAHGLPDEVLDQAAAALAGFECRFEVGDLHLYEYGTDGVWRAEQTFPFGVR
jgi:2'-5' RNA ligase